MTDPPPSTTSDPTTPHPAPAPDIPTLLSICQSRGHITRPHHLFNRLTTNPIPDASTYLHLLTSIYQHPPSLAGTPGTNKWIPPFLPLIESLIEFNVLFLPLLSTPNFLSIPSANATTSITLITSTTVYPLQDIAGLHLNAAVDDSPLWRRYKGGLLRAGQVRLVTAVFEAYLAEMREQMRVLEGLLEGGEGEEREESVRSLVVQMGWASLRTNALYYFVAGRIRSERLERLLERYLGEEGCDMEVVRRINEIELEVFGKIERW